MAVVVVGGHSRNIGKTSVVVSLITAFSHLHWTAFKITQFGHGVCSANGRPCACETADHTVAISEERGERPATDSGRFLAAGAARSLWVRTRQGQLFEAMPRIRREVEVAENVIFESNSILQFLKPDLYLTVIDPAKSDFKATARRYLDRADAILEAGQHGTQVDGAWAGVGRTLLEATPRFQVSSPTYMTSALIDFVAARIATAALSACSAAEAIRGDAR